MPSIGHIKKNKDKELRWAAVDDARIYKFLEEIHSLPSNNQITGFESAQDITIHLREQWAGLFQRFLQEQEIGKQSNLVERMENMVGTLAQLTDLLSQRKDMATEAVTTIVTLSHPLFRRIQTFLELGFPVYFSTLTELNSLLKIEYYSVIEIEDMDYVTNTYGWRDSRGNIIYISTQLFDTEGKLLRLTEKDWTEESARHIVYQPSNNGEIPF